MAISDRSSEEGFSMIELMVVVMLMAIIMAGLFSLQDALLQQRGKILRNIAVRNQNDYARKLILRELASATLVLDPTPGSMNTNIVGWKNLDPSNILCCGNPVTCRACNYRGNNVRTDAPTTCACAGNIPGGAARPLSTTGAAPENQIQWFRFCLDTAAAAEGETPHLVYYKGTDFLDPLPAVMTEACGTTPPDETNIFNIGGFARVAIEATGPNGSIFNRTRHNWVEINFAATVETRIPSSGAIDTAKAETRIGVALMASNMPSTAW